MASIPVFCGSGRRVRFSPFPRRTSCNRYRNKPANPGLTMALLLFLLPGILIGCSNDGGNGVIGGGGGGGQGPAGPGTVTLTTDATWVAFQDGPSGAWTVATPDTMGGTVYTLDVTDSDGKFGIAAYAFVASSDMYTTKIVQATRDDTIDLNMSVKRQTGTLSGTISNMSASNESAISSKGVAAAVLSNGAGYNIAPMEGARDVIGVEKDANGDFVRGLLQRNYLLTPGGSFTVNVDFSSPNLTASAWQTFSAIGATPSVLLYTPTLASAGISDKVGTVNGQTTTKDYPFLSGTESGDLYYFQASTTGKSYGSWASASSNPGDKSVDLSTLAAFTAFSMDYTDITGLQYTPASGYPELHAFFISGLQSLFATDVNWQIILSKNWLGSATSYARPSFSGLAGYNTTWDYQSGFTVFTNGYAYMFDGGPGINWDGEALPAAGRSIYTASKNSSFAP